MLLAHLGMKIRESNWSVLLGHAAASVLALEVLAAWREAQARSRTRALIRRMSNENPTWGAPRIHGELLMFGVDVSESTVGRYMIRIGRPPQQGWKTFLLGAIPNIRRSVSQRGLPDGS
jgi:hypothetical protein